MRAEKIKIGNFASLNSDFMKYKISLYIKALIIGILSLKSLGF
jgi:hypothetical protein